MWPYFALLIIEALRFCNGFDVFWNVPTEKCESLGIHFNLSRYNIIQNSRDRFHGDHINILYGPGRFPHFQKDGVPVWGGIPQKGDAVKHIEAFEKQVAAQVPLEFSGYIVLDFEDYQPDFDSSSYIYKNASRAWVKARYPNWPMTMIDFVARSTFNAASDILFRTLLEVGPVLRPKARWGYYHYPYCSNPHPGVPACNKQQKAANNRMVELFKDSGVLYPSIYIFKDGWDPNTNGKQVLGRLLNAMEIQKISKNPILPYVWFKFHDDTETFLEPIHLWSTLGLAWHLKTDGAIIWGGSADVRTKEKCISLKTYVKNILGPVIKFLTAFS